MDLNKIPNELYEEFSKLFELPQMVGIIGGRGKFGLYFVGCQKDNLILLDPHFNQETVENETKIQENRDTYRWNHIRTIKIKKLDPWIGIGFIIRSYADFLNLTSKIEELSSSSNYLFGIRDLKITPDGDDFDFDH